MATFREKLQATDDYGWLAPRPRIPIGLRVRDASSFRDTVDTPDFLGRLAAIAMGMARNDMEDRLVTATHANTLVIEQPGATLPPHPKTGRPLDVLDIDGVTVGNIAAIIRSGEAAANSALRGAGHPAIYDASTGTEVEACLEEMLQRCEHAMRADPAAMELRANVYIAVGTQLEMRFSARMAGQSDDGLNWPDVKTGLTGWCYQARSPALCNLRLVAQVAEAGGEQRPFNMTRELQDAVESKRTWMMAHPVLDPAGW